MDTFSKDTDGNVIQLCHMKIIGREKKRSFSFKLRYSYSKETSIRFLLNKIEMVGHRIISNLINLTRKKCQIMPKKMIACL